MERVYIFDCDRIIGDEEKRTIIENMEGKAEVIFDNSEGYDRDTDIVISTRCVGNRDVAGMEVIIREDIGVGCDYVGTAPYVIYEPEEIDYYYCQKVYARKKGLPAFILETERFIVREESLDDLDELYELIICIDSLSTECGLYIPKIQAGLLDVWELRIEALTEKIFRK